MEVDLGEFTASELRLGGINERGFLQPVLPLPVGAGALPEAAAAADQLASRGLLVHLATGWRPVGRYERVLSAAAVGRSLLAVSPAGPAAALALPRLTFGCLGQTGWVLDLNPNGDRTTGFRARLLEAEAAIVELVGELGLAGWPSPSWWPSGEAIRDTDAGWARLEERLEGATATVRVEAAGIDGPGGPLRQHRLRAIRSEGGMCLVVGDRRGTDASRMALRSDPNAVGRLLAGWLGGRDPIS